MPEMSSPQPARATQYRAGFVMTPIEADLGRLPYAIPPGILCLKAKSTTSLTGVALPPHRLGHSSLNL